MKPMWLPIADSQSNNSRSVLGMTLIEIMVAVTLFSTILMAVSSLVRFGLEARLGWERAVAPIQMMERSLDRLAGDLESARPLFGVPFTAEHDALEFARLEMVQRGEAPPAPEWVRVRYRLETNADGVVLVRETVAWRQGDPPSEPWRREALLPLAAGQFSFGMLDEQGRLTWQPSWDGQTHKLPGLVKLECTFPPVGGQPPTKLTRVMRNPSGELPPVNPAPSP